MSISVSRESISKLMTELVDTFPMESEGRSSISDFGKLLFTEGQSAANATTSQTAAPASSGSTTSAASTGNGASNAPASEEDDDACDDDADDDEEEEEDEEQSAIEDAKIAGAPATSTPGQKRVFTEIKGVPRQKQPDVQCVVAENGKISLSQSSMRKIMKSKDKAVPKRWTQEEDDRLREAVGRHGERNWKSIAEEVPGRNHTQCLQRWTKVLAPGLVKGHWRPDEDELLKELVAEGRKNWGQVATRIPGRTSKQCRERWYNHLDPSIVRGEYSAEEDRIILEAQSRLGNRWSAIAAMLPGRTEDAVKIRWKSLCRVRKGQGRRTAAQGDKPRATTPKGSGMMPPAHHMLHHHAHLHPHHTSGGGSFSGGPMIKSEELGAFSTPTMRAQQQMNRMQYASAMNAQQQQQQIAMGGSNGSSGAGASGTYHILTAPGATHSMLYASDMTAVPTPTAAMYDPSTGQYRKAPAGMAMYSLPSTIPVTGQDYSTRATMATLSTPTHQQSYRTASGGYATTVSSPYAGMATDMNGNVYATTSAGNGGYVLTAMSPMYHPRPEATLMSPHVAQQQQQQQQMMMSASYGYSAAPSTPANSSGTGANLASSFAQSIMPQQQQSYQQQPQQATHESGHEQSSPSPPQQLKSAQAAAQTAAQSTAAPSAASDSSSSAPPAAPFNPAAMFAQSQQPMAGSSSSSSGSAKPAVANPVAAFLQQQQQQHKPKAAASAPRPPFNPAAAFAQRFQSGKPPMPAAGAAAKSNSVSSSGRDDGDGDNDDDDDAENGDKNSVEPSLKKVKPRLSIDAARASAARRMRNSGAGAAALAGRGSLDVFLNEIGDVGRLSDLKMDEFQTLDELWRVSDDMNRLSL